MINTILKTSIIPTGFKIGKVTPIYKSGEKNLFDNYHPITVLPIISKILEKCVYQQLTEYLESNNLLSKQQFGFCKGRSTETATTLFLDDIHKARDKSQLTGAIFIDLSKAFDTISHSSILEKLPSYGITGHEKAFFTDYLFNRWQRVSYKSILSTSKPIFCGVPQGSILGALLFLLHFNNAEKQLEKCKIIMYAHDRVIYYQHKDIASIEKALSSDFNLLSNWMEKNELILNLKKGKTEVMLFGTNSRLSKQNQNVKISYRANEINCTETYKYLGVNLDPTLNLGEHFSYVYKKASSRLRLLRRIRPQLTNIAALRVYQSLIIPIITYCSLTNYFSQSYRFRLLELLETRALNIIQYTNKRILTIQQ